MLNSVYQKKKPSKNQMLKKSVNMISMKYTNTQKVMNIKKKEGESWICYSAQTV